MDDKNQLLKVKAKFEEGIDAYMKTKAKIARLKRDLSIQEKALSAQSFKNKVFEEQMDYLANKRD